LTQWLLDAGANPLAMNYWGSTALDIAERNENNEALALLHRYLI
jgi:ankyrin repeat protein